MTDADAIVAVVVTYNRCALLAETLRAIEAQGRRPACIVIVDNHSTDGTADMLATLELEVPFEHLRLDRNTGGAGGFKAGMQRAYALGADWLWVMDDDCIAAPDALGRLLDARSAAGTERPGFLASRVLWQDGTPCLMNLPVAHRLWIAPHATAANVTRVLSSSFVSMLVAREAVEAVGYPVAEFFIWFDDVEYSRRISAVMPAYLVTDSVVVHKTPTNLAPLDFTQLDEASLWKFRYGVRNECSFQLRANGIADALLFVARTIARMRRARVPARHLRPLLGACVEGLRFDYTRHVSYPDGRADRPYAARRAHASRWVE
ncbi:MAG: glycosyltransferase family 2 protein [Gammaproteobacteria bacterium]